MDRAAGRTLTASRWPCIETSAPEDTLLPSGLVQMPYKKSSGLVKTAWRLSL